MVGPRLYLSYYRRRTKDQRCDVHAAPAVATVIIVSTVVFAPVAAIFVIIIILIIIVVVTVVCIVGAAAASFLNPAPLSLSHSASSLQEQKRSLHLPTEWVHAKQVLRRSFDDAYTIPGHGGDPARYGDPKRL